MEQLLSLVTSFFLPTEDVQTLLDAGRDLLHDHPEFQRLLRDGPSGGLHRHGFVLQAFTASQELAV